MAVIITISFLTLPVILCTIINYYILDLGDESFILFCPTKFVSFKFKTENNSNQLKRHQANFEFNRRWPFDWKTPLGYLMAWLVQSAMCATAGLTDIVFFNLIFGSCWLFIHMSEDTTMDLAAFNTDITSNRKKIRPQTMKSFCDIVQLYTDAKQ